MWQKEVKMEMRRLRAEIWGTPLVKVRDNQQQRRLRKNGKKPEIMCLGS